jgi:hypothetical protein
LQGATVCPLIFAVRLHYFSERLEWDMLEACVLSLPRTISAKVFPNADSKPCAGPCAANLPQFLVMSN